MIKSFQLAESNLSPNFIGSWMIDNSLCNELVVYFENNQGKLQQGAVGSNASGFSFLIICSTESIVIGSI